MSILKKSRIKILYLKKKYKNVIFGNNIQVLGKLPYLKLFKDSECAFGENVVINSDFRNSNTALSNRCKFVLGYTGKLNIGENTMLNGCSITAYQSVTIGKNCQIASSSFITDTDFHPIDPAEREKQVTRKKYDLATVNKADVVIGDNVWIGWGSIILKGTVIGNNCVVGAGSLVTGDISGECCNSWKSR